MQRLVRRPLFARLEQRLRIEPQGLRSATGGVGSGEPGGRFLQQAGPAVQVTARLLGGRPLSEAGGWLRLLAAYDIAFVTLATLLFPFTVDE